MADEAPGAAISAAGYRHSRHTRVARSLEDMAVERRKEDLSRHMVGEALSRISQGLVVLDERDRIVYVNKWYLDFFGFSDGAPQVQPGQPFEDVLRYLAGRGEFGPGNREGQVRERLEPLLHRENWHMDRRRVDGRYFHITGNTLAHGGYVFTFTDVTDRVTETQRIAEAERKYRGIFENAQEGIFQSDRQGRLVTANPALATMLGYESAEMLIDTVRDLDQQLFAIPGARTELVGKVMRNGKVHDFETDLLRGDGSKFAGSLTVHAATDETGFVTHMEGMVQDITARRERERAVHEREAAEAANAAKTAFLASMSHEIRTPMNGVLGMARLLAGTKLDPEQREFAETIVRSGESLLRILDDLLDISKLEAGKLEIEVIPMDPRRFFYDAVAVMMARAKEKGLAFEHEVDPKVPLAIQGDPHRLRQILLNLIGNAVKFTETGCITVNMTSQPRPNSEIMLVVSVSDTGPGVSRSAQEKLFLPYEQGAVEVARKYGGTGLGLAICRRLTDLMGGDLVLESTPGLGACFTFKVPMKVALVQDVPAVKSTSKRSSKRSASLEPMDILLVEDSVINQKVAIASLKKQGHRVTLAENGQQAIDKLAQHSFDVILMDRHMPVMDGIRATRQIRAMKGGFEHLPIIGVTAAARETEIEECLAAGMNEVIVKPIDPAMLNLAIADILSSPMNVQDDALSSEDTIWGETDSGGKTSLVLDIKKIRDLRDEYGDDLADELIGDFKDVSRQALDGILSACDSANRQELKHQAHSLKGVSWTLGLAALSEHCLSIENACIDDDMDAARDRAEQLPDLVGQALRALESTSN